MISRESVMTRSPCCALWQVARVGLRRSGLRLICAASRVGVKAGVGLDHSNGRTAMRRLLSLAVLVFALWAIDAYAFNGRYWAAAGEEVNYYAKILNDTVQGLTNRLRP